MPEKHISETNKTKQKRNTGVRRELPGRHSYNDNDSPEKSNTHKKKQKNAVIRRHNNKRAAAMITLKPRGHMVTLLLLHTNGSVFATNMMTIIWFWYML